MHCEVFGNVYLFVHILQYAGRPYSSVASADEAVKEGIQFYNGWSKDKSIEQRKLGMASFHTALATGDTATFNLWCLTSKLPANIVVNKLLIYARPSSKLSTLLRHVLTSSQTKLLKPSCLPVAFQKQVYIVQCVRLAALKRYNCLALMLRFPYIEVPFSLYSHILTSVVEQALVTANATTTILTAGDLLCIRAVCRHVPEDIPAAVWKILKNREHTGDRHAVLDIYDVLASYNHFPPQPGVVESILAVCGVLVLKIT